MKRIASVGLFALAALLGGAMDADAQLTPAPAPNCADYATFGSVSYFACGGAFLGNNENQDTEGWIQNNWGISVTHAGTTEAGSEAGPLGGFGNSSSGTITFDNPLTGNFILALKAGDTFSLYWFTGQSDLASLDFSTTGAGVNEFGQPQGLSHASLYDAGIAVPEPGTMLLLATGLMGMMFLRRREELA